jgi:lipid A 3-O-deacylase
MRWFAPMDFSSKAYHRADAVCTLTISLLLAAAASRAQGLRFEWEEFGFESAGARYGFPVDHRSQGFSQAEAFVNLNLPWKWNLGADWNVQSRLDASAGWLGREGFDAALVTLGPSLVLRDKWLPLSLEGGLSVTGLSRDEFGSKDLGGHLQFTSHAGLNWDFASHWRVGYRFQHTSNAGLRAPNPGLNLHLFAVSYVF